jgi:hypothetical protein
MLLFAARISVFKINWSYHSVTSWLLLRTRLRHEIDVATEIDTAMETDWTCVPLIATAKPVARRKFAIRWQPALPGCILVPFENSGHWDGIRHALGYVRDPQLWPYLIPASHVARFTECLSAVNSVALNANTKGQAQKGKKQTYQRATQEVLAQIARDLFGVDISASEAA